MSKLEGREYTLVVGGGKRNQCLNLEVGQSTQVIEWQAAKTTSTTETTLDIESWTKHPLFHRIRTLRGCVSDTHRHRHEGTMRRRSGSIANAVSRLHLLDALKKSAFAIPLRYHFGARL